MSQTIFTINLNAMVLTRRPQSVFVGNQYQKSPLITLTKMKSPKSARMYSRKYIGDAATSRAVERARSMQWKKLKKNMKEKTAVRPCALLGTNP